MDIGSPELLEGVQRLLKELVSNSADSEDLLQDILLFVWSLPGQPHRTLSWCLQRTKFLILDKLKLGRSIDAPKRRRFGTSLDSGDDPDDILIRHNLEQKEVIQHVCARDAFEVLWRHLCINDRMILKHLARGLSAPDIARTLGLACSTVNRRRARIAIAATHLGIGL